jgi:NTE family protein
MLDWVWDQVLGAQADFPDSWMYPLPPAVISSALEYSLPYQMGEAFSRVVSPYAWGPLYKNPLEPIVRKLDFDCVCAETGPALFICATHVRNGKIRVFQGDDITTEAIMASACLPTLFQAVEMDDSQTGRREAFWDGGYTGNPALFPLFDRSFPADIVVVNINPLERDAVPVTPQEISNRINEISFNSSLLREMRAIQFVQDLLDDGTLTTERKSRVLMHMIADDGLMNELNVATKVVPNVQLIRQLKEAGRAAAHSFLREHKADLNIRSSVDMRAMFN